MEYIVPIKNEAQLNKICNFMHNLEDPESWKEILNDSVIDYLKIDKELYGDNESIKELLIKKKVLKVIHNNCIKFKQEYEKQCTFKLLLSNLYILIFIGTFIWPIVEFYCSIFELYH